MRFDKPTIKWHDDKIKGLAVSKQKSAILKGCILLQNYIKQSMKMTPRLAFKKYKVRKTGKISQRYHHPSAPDYPPAIDTGRLMNSISYITSWGSKSGKNTLNGFTTLPNEYAGKIGTNLRVGKGLKWCLGILLEFGTRKMKNRPFLRPALYTNYDRLKMLLYGIKLK